MKNYKKNRRTFHFAKEVLPQMRRMWLYHRQYFDLLEKTSKKPQKTITYKTNLLKSTMLMKC